VVDVENCDLTLKAICENRILVKYKRNYYTFISNSSISNFKQFEDSLRERCGVIIREAKINKFKPIKKYKFVRGDSRSGNLKVEIHLIQKNKINYPFLTNE
jgi:hypothetical protein